MKRILILLLSINGVMANAQSWLSFKQYGGDKADDFRTSIRMPAGEYLVTWSYNSEFAVFGQDTISVPTWYDYDIGLMKTSSNGDVIWARRFGGANDGPEHGLDYPTAIAYDGLSNSIFLAGNINGRNAASGSCDLSQVSLIALDSVGACSWSVYGLYGYYSGIDDICPDGIGSVYVSGGTTYAGSIGGSVLDSGAFIIKYDVADGSVKWARNVLPPRCSIRMEYRGGKIYFVGFSGRPSITVGSTTLTGFDSDFLVGRMDTSGTIDWIHRYGGPGVESLPRMRLDAENNILLSTTFDDSCHVDTSLFLTGGVKGYLMMKVDSAGNIMWLWNGLSNFSLPISGSVFTGPDGAMYANVLLYAPGYFGNDTLVPVAGRQNFLLKYSPQGILMGFIAIDDAVLRFNDVYVEPTGELTLWTSFDLTCNIPPYSLVADGVSDIIMVRHAPIVGIPTVGQRMANLVVYANPNQGNFRIEVPQRMLRAERLNLKILDQQGRIVSETSVSAIGDRLTIEVGELNSGLYELLLSDGKQMARGRVVIE